MGKKSSAKRGRREGEPSSKAKGALVEQIVASMHDVADVLVQKNVFLPVATGRRRTREIDVLLTSAVAGYHVRFAIECKNEQSPTGAPAIDAFIGKLADIGIPAQYGIFVVASGYTRDALDRAQQAGIKTLVLRGLSEDRLASAITEVMQSVVHCLLDVRQMIIQNSVPRAESPDELYLLYDEAGRLRLSVPDIIWLKWTNNEPPLALGEYTIELPIPEGLHTLVDGHPQPISHATARVQVLGLVMALRGEATHHSLNSAHDGTSEKSRIHARFNAPQGTYTLLTMQTETELASLTAQGQTHIRITTRVRLPRIKLDAMYWPPSQRTAESVIARMQAFLAGQGQDPRPLRFEDVEGTDLRTIWEPIWDGHPAGHRPVPPTNRSPAGPD